MYDSIGRKLIEKMIYVCLFDTAIRDDIVKLQKPSVILSSVNNATHAINANGSENARIHKIIRFEQFKCFHENLQSVVNEPCDIYLKYGGFCFLDDWDSKRFEFVKNHFKFLLKYKKQIEIDADGNNNQFDIGSNYRLLDKVLIEKILKYNALDLLYFRPVPKVLQMDKKTLYETVKDMSVDDLKRSGYITLLHNNKNAKKD